MIYSSKFLSEDVILKQAVDYILNNKLIIPIFYEEKNSESNLTIISHPHPQKEQKLPTQPKTALQNLQANLK